MKLTPIKQARLLCAMTQEEAVRAFGISNTYLSNIESYRKPATPEVLQKMIKLYKCNMRDLFPIERMINNEY